MDEQTVADFLDSLTDIYEICKSNDLFLPDIELTVKTFIKKMESLPINQEKIVGETKFFILRDGQWWPCSDVKEIKGGPDKYRLLGKVEYENGSIYKIDYPYHFWAYCKDGKLEYPWGTNV